MKDVKTYILPRDNGPDVRFTGELIAAVNSHRPGSDRWTELILHRTTSGKWICYEVGVTTHEGEIDRHAVHVCADDDELQAAVGHGWLAKQLYSAAKIAAFEDID